MHRTDALRYLIELVGAERVFLGSDYPFPLGEHVPGSLIEQMDELTPAGRERLLSGTAIEFLGVDPSRFR